MLVVLAWSARDVELTARQFFWLGVATVTLAGLCAWIISWEADESEIGEDAAAAEVSAAADGPSEGQTPAAAISTAEVAESAGEGPTEAPLDPQPSGSGARHTT